MATEKGIVLSLLGRNNSALAINIPHESLTFLIDAEFDIIKNIFTNLIFLNFQSPRRLSSSHIVGTIITNCYNASHVCGRIFNFGFLSDITSQCMTSYHIRIFLYVCSRLYDGIRCFESCGNGENAYPMNPPQFQEEKIASVEHTQSLLEYFRDELLQYRIRQSSDLSNNSYLSNKFLSNILNAWYDAAALFQVPQEESANLAKRIIGLQPPSKPTTSKLTTEESVRVDARLLTDIRTSLRKAIEASESDLALKIPSTALWNILILAETFGTTHITQCCLSILHYQLCPTTCDLSSDVRSQLPFPASDSLPPDTIAEIINKLEGHVHYFGPPPNPLWIKAKLRQEQQQQPLSPGKQYPQQQHQQQQSSSSSSQHSISEERISHTNKFLKDVPSLSLTPADSYLSNFITKGYSTNADNGVIKILSPLSSARTDTSDSYGDNITFTSRIPLDATTTPQYNIPSLNLHPTSTYDNQSSCDSIDSSNGDILRYQTAEDHFNNCEYSGNATGKSEKDLRDYLAKAEWVISESMPYPGSSLPTVVPLPVDAANTGQDVYSTLPLLPSQVHNNIRDRSHKSLLSSSSTSLSGTSSLSIGEVEVFDESGEEYLSHDFRRNNINNSNNNIVDIIHHIPMTASSISLNASTTASLISTSPLPVEDSNRNLDVYSLTPITDDLTPMISIHPSSSLLTPPPTTPSLPSLASLPSTPLPQHANALNIGLLPSVELEIRERQELDQLRYLQMIRRRVKESPNNNDNDDSSNDTNNNAEETLGITVTELDGNLVATALFRVAEPMTSISHQNTDILPSEKSALSSLPLPLPAFGNQFIGSSCDSSMDYDEYDVKYHDGKIQVVKKSPLKKPKEYDNNQTATTNSMSNVPVAMAKLSKSPSVIPHKRDTSSTPKEVSTRSQRVDTNNGSSSSSGNYSWQPSDVEEVREGEGEGGRGRGIERSRHRFQWDTLKWDEKDDQARSSSSSSGYNNNPRALVSPSSRVLSDTGYSTTTTTTAASLLTRRNSMNNKNEASLRAAERVKKHRRALSLQKDKEIKEKLREEENKNRNREEKIQFAITKQEGSLCGSMYDTDGHRRSLPPATIFSSTSSATIRSPHLILSSMSSLSGDKTETSLSPSSFAGCVNTPISKGSTTRSTGYKEVPLDDAAGQSGATISPRSIGTSFHSFQTPIRTLSTTEAMTTPPTTPPLEDIIPPYIHPRHRLSGLSLTSPEKESCYEKSSSFNESTTTLSSTLRARDKSAVVLSPPVMTATAVRSDLPATECETFASSNKIRSSHQQIVLEEVTSLQALITSTLNEGRQHRDSSAARSPLSSRNSHNPMIFSDIWNTNKEVMPEDRFSNNSNKNITLAQTYELESTTRSQGIISLKVKRAWNLPDLLGGTNAYVVLNWGSLGTGRTPVIYDCMEPIFDYIIQFKPSLDPSSPTVTSPYPSKESPVENDGYENSNQSVNNIYAIPLLIQLFSRNISVSDEFLGQSVVTFNDLNSAKDGFLTLKINSESFHADFFLELLIIL